MTEQEYRQRAIAARQEAEKTKEQALKSAFAKIAEQWERMAQQVAAHQMSHLNDNRR